MADLLERAKDLAERIIKEGWSFEDANTVNRLAAEIRRLRDGVEGLEGEVTHREGLVTGYRARVAELEAESTADREASNQALASSRTRLEARDARVAELEEELRRVYPAPPVWTKTDSDLWNERHDNDCECYMCRSRANEGLR